MRYIKTYETLNESLDPEIGDFVICKENIKNNSVAEFTSNNIGKLVDIDEVDYSAAHYIVGYKDVPEKYNDYFRIGTPLTELNKESKRLYRRMHRDEIIYWSPNKEDCKAYLAAKKYNL